MKKIWAMMRKGLREAGRRLWSGKRWAALVLSGLLLVQPGLPLVSAAGDVFFVGAEENILPMEAATMPFRQNNAIYIPGDIFTEVTRTSLKIGSSSASDGSWIALYWGKKALLFKNDVSYAEDQSGRRYYPGAVERNGHLFVPADLVAEFFGLRYSELTVNHGTLVWLRTKGFILEEDLFLNAAYNVMEQRYADYLKTQRKEDADSSLEQETPAEDPIRGKPLYLCAQADSNTPILLDLLERYDSFMTFFCTPEFIAEQADLLRRIAGSGHAIGILVREGEDLPPVEEQLQQANEALDRATWEKTRLVRVEGVSPDTIQRLLTEGWYPEVSTLEPQRMLTGTQASTLFRQATAGRETTVLWLGEEILSGGLATFLSRAQQVGDPCVALRETVPFS